MLYSTVSPATKPGLTINSYKPTQTPKPQKTANPQWLIEQYLLYIRQVENVAETTYRNRKHILRPFFAALDITDLSTLTIQQVDEQLNAELQNCKPSTIQAKRQTLRSFFQFCQAYHKISMSFEWAMIRRIRVAPPRIKTLSPYEVSYVVGKCRIAQDALMIAVLYESGLRIGEMVKLVCDDLVDTQLRVRGKGERDRVVFITKDLAVVLMQFLNDERRYGRAHIFQPLQHHSNHANFKYGTCAVRERIQARFAEAGHKDMHPHQLRHSYAIAALEAGMDVRTLQKLLGHANLDTTMRYLQITDRYVEENYHKYFSRSVVRNR